MKKVHEYWVSLINKRDYNPVVQHRIIFYNIFLYACSIYIAAMSFLFFRSTEEFSFVFTYTMLYMLIPLFAYTFDKRKLLRSEENIL